MGLLDIKLKTVVSVTHFTKAKESNLFIMIFPPQGLIKQLLGSPYAAMKDKRPPSKGKGKGPDTTSSVHLDVSQVPPTPHHYPRIATVATS